VFTSNAGAAPGGPKVYCPANFYAGYMTVGGGIAQNPQRNPAAVDGVSASTYFVNGGIPGATADIVIGTSTLHSVGGLFTGTTP
jgi:hypothetical protein